MNKQKRDALVIAVADAKDELAEYHTIEEYIKAGLLVGEIQRQLRDIHNEIRELYNSRKVKLDAELEKLHKIRANVYDTRVKKVRKAEKALWDFTRKMKNKP